MSFRRAAFFLLLLRLRDRLVLHFFVSPARGVSVSWRPHHRTYAWVVLHYTTVLGESDKKKRKIPRVPNLVAKCHSREGNILSRAATTGRTDYFDTHLQGFYCNVRRSSVFSEKVRMGLKSSGQKESYHGSKRECFSPHDGHPSSCQRCMCVAFTTAYSRLFFALKGLVHIPSEIHYRYSRERFGGLLTAVWR